MSFVSCIMLRLMYGTYTKIVSWRSNSIGRTWHMPTTRYDFAAALRMDPHVFDQSLVVLVRLLEVSLRIHCNFLFRKVVT